MNNQKEYKARINKALDYIEHNIDEKLNLEDIAKSANFSKFHFHRIFTAFVGESPNCFIQRIRIEKAANSLLLNPEKSITAIALDCGFSSSSSFARLFKESMGVSASRWRNENSKISKVDSNFSITNSNDSEDMKSGISYFVNREAIGTKPELLTKLRRYSMNNNVTVKKFDDMPVVYVRHIGAYQGKEELFGALFGKLFKWAGPRGLLNNSDLKVLSVYHDNPEITDDEKLRVSVCLTAPEDTDVSGEIGKMVVPGGEYAVGHFRINPDEYQQSWDMMYGKWLPNSGYQPDDRPSFELCLNDPSKDPEGMHEVDICIPVMPL